MFILAYVWFIMAALLFVCAVVGSEGANGIS